MQGFLNFIIIIFFFLPYRPNLNKFDIFPGTQVDINILWLLSCEDPKEIHLQPILRLKPYT